MASTKEYRNFILEQLDKVTYKPMMGEYLLYYDGILIGGIYDDRVLVKKTNTNSQYNMEDAVPYEGAKPMYLVSDVDNKELLQKIIVDTYQGL
jgi:TfoX/Sxy family transcriptional regulator of competence genes